MDDSPAQWASHESALVARASTGDMVAVTVLLSHSHEMLKAFLTARIPRDLQAALDVDDVIQEAQVEVFRHVSRFEPRGEGSFHRWVAAIALRKLRNAIRARRTLKRGGHARQHAGREESLLMLLDLLAGPEETPSRTVARQEAVTAVERAVTDLPPHYQDAVRMVYLEGRSVSEAAQQMGRTPRAIHNLCHKAKQRMRHTLGSSTRFLSRS